MSSSASNATAFKDLCLDTTDASVAALFWAPVLGLSAQHRDGNVRLVDDVDEHTVWLNLVPEEKSSKNRVHLDVHTAAVADLEAFGARVLDDTQPWTVMADPEGGEFCAFVRPSDQLPRYRLYEVVVDCVDPGRIATWWAEQFGVEAQRDPTGTAWYLDDGPGLPWEMVFDAVPEPKTVKNRVHWDVWGTTATLLAAGATVLRRRDDQQGLPGRDAISWDVLADPEGNEFCVFARE